MSKIIENKHIDLAKETWVKCDASKLGLGASLEKKNKEHLAQNSISGRFLNPVEQRYSTNELQLIALVWSLEHFKPYLKGAEFTLQTDHQAFLKA